MFQRTLNHRIMLSDRVRMESYQKAIMEVVKSGDVVADIGTGSGILAFFAVKAGARRVYAIEKEKIIEEAKRIALLNGFEKNIIFINQRSDKVNLPEKVDVILSELIGYFGLEENLLRFKIDARKRFLKQGGKLVPERIELYLAPIRAKGVWEKYIGCWEKNFYGIDFSELRDFSASQRYIIDFSEFDFLFLSKKKKVVDFDFYLQDTIPYSFQVDFFVENPGEFHGIIGFFSLQLYKNIIIDTSPQAIKTHWKQIFFPVSDPYFLIKNDVINLEITAIPFGGTIFWRWEIRVFRSGKMIFHNIKTNINVTKEDYCLHQEEFRPVLHPDCEVTRRILNLCDGNRSMKEIAKAVHQEFRGKFKNQREAFLSIISMLRNNVIT